MKKITFILCLLTYVVNAQVDGYNVGDVVDDFTVTDVEGVEHNLYTYLAAGKHVYLDFFFDTCGPCQTTTPIFNEFHDKYGCNDGAVVMISVNNGSDSDAEVIAFENSFGGPFNHAPAISADGGAGAVDSNFDIVAYPTYCLIGPDMTLLESDIWPLTGVETFEATFPAGFNPPVMSCSLGVTDANSTLDFVIYPTVSNGSEINIVLNEYADTDVNVYDVMGRRVFYNNFSQKNIQFSLNAVSGSYFVNIASENSSVTKTIIIK
jgi:thiol-disulfide isomerase/thioredoxin